MKSSGFNIGITHLNDIDRIEKLRMIAMLAFVWCYKIGIFIYENIREIEIKKHGSKAKSIFKYGLSFVASVLLNPCNLADIGIYSFLLCT